MPFLARFTSPRNPSKAPAPLSLSATSSSPATPTPQLSLTLPSHSLLLDSDGVDDLTAEFILSNSRSTISSSLVHNTSGSPVTSPTSIGTAPGTGEGDVESEISSPWEKVDFLEDVSGSGFVGVRMDGERRTNVESDRERERRKEAERRDKRLIDGAVLGVAEVTDLVRECGAVIRERGALTLGIFRPHRFAESPVAFRKLCILFLTYVQAQITSTTNATTVKSSNNALDGVNTKEAKLERFRDELKFAGIHDVVAVLKWGLRHLSSSASFGGLSTTSTPLSWYHNFLPLSAPPSSFTTQLLPSIPDSSRVLLLELLLLLESISAHSESNAMSPRKLSRTLALYAFGLSDPTEREWKDWEELYSTWKDAGEALEGSFKSYLRSEGVETLPARLRELVVQWPPTANSRADKSRFVRVVLVKLESQGEWKREVVGVNDQRTGLEAGREPSAVRKKSLLGESGPRRRLLRRRPLEILRAAIDAKSPDANGQEEAGVNGIWRIVVEKAKEDGGVKNILNEDFLRVLDLLGLDDEKPQDAGKPSTTRALPELVDRPFKRTKGASEGAEVGLELGSLEEEGTTLASLKNSFNSPVVLQQRQGGSTTMPAPSWSEFQDKGFGDKVPFETNEFGLVIPAANSNGRTDDLKKIDSGATIAGGRKMKKLEGGATIGGVRRAHTLSGVSLKSALLRPRETPVNATTQEKVDDTPRPTLEPSTSIVSITYFDLEEEFVDTYLDTLVDSTGACSTWPSFVIAPLSPSVVSSFSTIIPSSSSFKVEHLLISESLVPFAPVQPTEHQISRSPTALSNSARSMVASLADSTTTTKGRWNRRMSGFFSGSLSGSGNGFRAKLLGSTSHDSLVSNVAHPGSRANGRTSPPPVLEMPSISSTLELPTPGTSTSRATESQTLPPQPDASQSPVNVEKPLPPPVIIMTAPSIISEDVYSPTATMDEIVEEDLPQPETTAGKEIDAVDATSSSPPQLSETAPIPVNEIEDDRVEHLSTNIPAILEPVVEPEPIPEPVHEEQEVAETDDLRESMELPQDSPSLVERRLSQDTLRAVDLDLETVQIEEVVRVAGSQVPEVLNPVSAVAEKETVAAVDEEKRPEPETEVEHVPISEPAAEDATPVLESPTEAAVAVVPAESPAEPTTTESTPPHFEHHSHESSDSTIDSPSPLTPLAPPEGPAPFSYLVGDVPPHPSTFASAIPAPKKFLGSKTMGSLINRKSSTSEASVLVAPDAPALVQRSAVIPPPEPKKAQEKKVPVPVSSVKRRVMELEAEVENIRRSSFSSVGRSASLSSMEETGDQAGVGTRVASSPTSPSLDSSPHEEEELAHISANNSAASRAVEEEKSTHVLVSADRAHPRPPHSPESPSDSTSTISPAHPNASATIEMVEDVTSPSTPKFSATFPLPTPSVTVPSSHGDSPLNKQRSKASLAETNNSFETADSGAESQSSRGSLDVYV